MKGSLEPAQRCRMCLVQELGAFDSAQCRVTVDWKFLAARHRKADHLLSKACDHQRSGRFITQDVGCAATNASLLEIVFHPNPVFSWSYLMSFPLVLVQVET